MSRVLAALTIAISVLLVAPTPASSNHSGLFNPDARIDQSQIDVRTLGNGALLFRVFVR